MTEDQIIDQIIHSFAKYNIRDIEEINKSELDFTIAEFILCSCLIDQLSGFRYNDEHVGVRYRNFIKDYLPNYDSDKLYKDLRNKLVHNYSIGSYYMLTRKKPSCHLKNIDGRICLNLEDFISDLKTAFDKYIYELRSDSDIRCKALSWYTKYKILVLASQ